MLTLVVMAEIINTSHHLTCLIADFTDRHAPGSIVCMTLKQKVFVWNTKKNILERF